MGNFRSWYIKHQDSISWFIIGLMAAATFDALAEGKPLWALGYIALGYINYLGTKFKMQ